MKRCCLDNDYFATKHRVTAAVKHKFYVRCYLRLKLLNEN